MNTRPGRRRAGATLVRVAMAGLAGGLAVFLALTTQPAFTTRASPPYGIVNTYLDPSPAANEEFGNALALSESGDRVFVAARSDRLSGTDPIGAAYILSTTTGAILHELNEPSPAALDYFGYSLAVSGTRALVGAPLNNTNASHAGAAFLYDTDSGALVQTFDNPSASAQDHFGASVAILSDAAVLIGVPQYSSTFVGRAYICLIADGTCLKAIDSPSLDDHGQFGISVVSLGNKFAVAAPFDGVHGTVYVFTTTSGLLYQTITLPITTTTSGDNFGSSLAVVNGNLLIGAQNGGTSFVNTPGAAYLYSPDGVLLSTFHDPNATDSGALFGAAVAGDGNVVLIGAPIATGAALGEGRAYIFDATTGALIDTLQKTSPAADDHFGNAVAMLGESFVVGAPGDSQGAASAGAVYRFGVKDEWDLYFPLIRK